MKIATRSPRLGFPTQSVLVVLAGPPNPPPPLPTQTPSLPGLCVLIWSAYHPPSSPIEDYTPVWHVWPARDWGRAARMAASSAPLSQTTLMSAGCERERALYWPETVIKLELGCDQSSGPTPRRPCLCKPQRQDSPALERPSLQRKGGERGCTVHKQGCDCISYLYKL